MRYNLVDGKYGDWFKAVRLAHAYTYSGVYGDDIAFVLYEEDAGFLPMSFDNVDRCWYVESDEDIVGIVAPKKKDECSINITINLEGTRVLQDHTPEARHDAIITALDAFVAAFDKAGTTK